MLGRRGTLVDLMLSPTFMLVVAALVMAAILAFVYGIGGETTFAKRFLANDLALVLDAVPAARGDLDILFGPMRAELGTTPVRFTYAVKHHTVRVSEDGSDPGIAYFADSSNAVVRDALLTPAQRPVLPRIIKRGRDVRIVQGGVKTDFMHLACPPDPVPLGTVVIDAGHGFSPKGGMLSDPGRVSGEYREHRLTREIAKGLVDRGGYGVTRSVRPPPSAGSQEGEEQVLSLDERQRLAAGADTVISVHIGNGTGQPMIAWILPGAKQAASYTLACEIVNSLAGRFGLTQAAVVPFLPDRAPEKGFRVLQPGKAGVVLEIGNIRDPLMLTDTDTLARAIQEGIEHAQG